MKIMDGNSVCVTAMGKNVHGFRLQGMLSTQNLNTTWCRNGHGQCLSFDQRAAKKSISCVGRMLRLKVVSAESLRDLT